MVGIGEIATGISLTKDSYAFLKYFRKLGLKYFNKESVPLDCFQKQNVTIVCSSLFAPIHNESDGYFSLFKPQNEKNVAPIPIGSGFYVTGVYDAFALSKLSIALINKNVELSLATDSCKEQLKTENLCLIGGTSSNLIAKDIYNNYIPKKYQFYNSEGGINIHKNSFSGGNYGHILFMINPWNKDKRILWMAGLGSFGTGSAVDFIINHFHSKAPKELTNHNNWVTFVQGLADKSENLLDVNQIGHYLLP